MIDCTADLPAQVTQGQLVVARIAAECRVVVDARAARVSPTGVFIFGIGRDATEVAITTVAPDGMRRTQRLTVAKRTFRTERVDGVPQQTVTPDPEIAARIAREQAEVAKARTRDDAREDFRFGFVQPVAGRVSGVYGSQRVLNGVPKDPHFGLDLAAPTGTAVKAPAAGVVSFARKDLYLTGGTVLLDHGHGLTSSFLHLSRLDVDGGDRVEQGEVIGAVGATGRASGPHLHWGMNWFDVRVDPQLLLAH